MLVLAGAASFRPGMMESSTTDDSLGSTNARIQAYYPCQNRVPVMECRQSLSESRGVTPGIGSKYA